MGKSIITFIHMTSKINDFIVNKHRKKHLKQITGIFLFYFIFYILDLKLAYSKVRHKILHNFEVALLVSCSECDIVHPARYRLFLQV